ncbi:hypothetical protein [Phaeodactylibacter sp.]|jgi:hypothetical protein|uniref:hypothetical protein n=1 Tax=Phaeodactylibacter sp. TaxID=1940289 RepID=UPI0025DFA9B4|nr:hypothetical protein [Phaeodactylibacter sp.]MCI4647697.1 hypothetical protein [Phaeodactylibacter sp.]MCI5091477.1 hypothetical protein [Phaeodactylibacter sp.]
MQPATLKMLTALMLFPLLLPGQGMISGFMNPKGTLDIAPGYGYEHFDEYRFGDETRAQELTTISYNLFAEYSMSDHGSVVINLPYLYINENINGVQDGSVFIKIRNGLRQFSSGKLNTITAVGLTTPLSAYPTTVDTPIGYGAVQFQGRLALQYNSNYGFFFHVQSGADFRFLSPLQTSIPILVRTGFGSAYYFVEGWVEWYNTLNNAVDQQVTGGAGSDWTRLGGTLYVPVYKGLGLAGNLAFIVGGRNIGLSSRYGFSLVYRHQSR